MYWLPFLISINTNCKCIQSKHEFQQVPININSFINTLKFAILLWDRHSGIDVDPNPLNYKEEGIAYGD